MTNSLISDYIDGRRDDIIRDAQRLISIESVYEDGGKAGEPFGPGIARALSSVLRLSEDMGFETENVDGCMGEINFGDSSEGKKIGVIAHVDVVPAGEGWLYPPFSGTISDGKLYGRGAIDDKGPLIACLYAMKAIRDLELPRSNHVRYLIGCDEESGFRCIKHYLEKKEQPWGGFSPDGEFPVIYGEKGIYRFTCKSGWADDARDIDHDRYGVVDITGGTRMNVVPEQAVAVLDMPRSGTCAHLDALRRHNAGGRLTADEDGRRLTITVSGKSAHSSMPWQGVNANNILLNFLKHLPLAPIGAERYLRSLADLFADGYEGKAAGIDCVEPEFGVLTLSMGIIRVDLKGGAASFDLRYPNLKDRLPLLEKLRAACGARGLNAETLQDKPGLYVPKESPMVRTLLRAYRDVSGRMEEPVVIGGGTYCRAMENFVAFGPLFPGQKELAHERDEYIGVDDLILCAKIYARALYDLVR